MAPIPTPTNWQPLPSATGVPVEADSDPIPVAAILILAIVAWIVFLGLIYLVRLLVVAKNVKCTCSGASKLWDLICCECCPTFEACAQTCEACRPKCNLPDIRDLLCPDCHRCQDCLEDCQMPAWMTACCPTCSGGCRRRILACWGSFYKWLITPTDCSKLCDFKSCCTGCGNCCTNCCECCTCPSCKCPEVSCPNCACQCKLPQCDVINCICFEVRCK